MGLRLPLVAMAIAAVGVAACSADTGGGSSNLSQLDTSATIQGLSKAELQFVLTSANVTVRSGMLGDDLFRAHVTYSSGQKPDITVDRTSGTVRVAQPPHTFSLVPQDDRGSIELTVSDRLPWTIGVTGGNFNTSLDLKGGTLSGVSIKGGNMRLDFSLPSPGGAVPLSVQGGAMTAAIHLPTATAAGVMVKGGQSSVQIDGKENAINGGTLQMATPGYDRAPNRYEVTFSGGSTKVSVSTG
jgi:hypothetical protein